MEGDGKREGRIKRRRERKKIEKGGERENASL